MTSRALENTLTAEQQSQFIWFIVREASSDPDTAAGPARGLRADIAARMPGMHGLGLDIATRISSMLPDVTPGMLLTGAARVFHRLPAGRKIVSVSLSEDETIIFILYKEKRVNSEYFVIAFTMEDNPRRHLGPLGVEKGKHMDIAPNNEAFIVKGHVRMQVVRRVGGGPTFEFSWGGVMSRDAASVYTVREDELMQFTVADDPVFLRMHRFENITCAPQRVRGTSDIAIMGEGHFFILSADLICQKAIMVTSIPTAFLAGSPDSKHWVGIFRTYIADASDVFAVSSFENGPDYIARRVKYEKFPTTNIDKIFFIRPNLFCVASSRKSEFPPHTTVYEIGKPAPAFGIGEVSMDAFGMTTNTFVWHDDTHVFLRKLVTRAALRVV